MSVLVLRSSVITSYSTNFDATENPISESSRWAKTDTTRTAVRTSGGLAFGTQDGLGTYDDSQATLSGFATNCEAILTVYRDPSISVTNHEIGFGMRTVETSNSTKKYEFLINKDGGLQFMKWLGPASFSGFRDLGIFSGSGSVSSPQSGDKFRGRVATLSSTLVELTLWYRPISTGTETEICRARDDSSVEPCYLTGQPGINFYIPDPTGNPAHFCITNYSVANS